jgi:hypothetical protein
MAKDTERAKVKEKTGQTVEVSVAPKLDEIVGAGPFALAEGTPAMNLAKASSVEKLSALERRGFYRPSALKAGNSPLPISAGDLYLERIKILRAALGVKGDAKELRKSLIEAKEKVDQTLKANLTSIMLNQRKLEQAWRELDTFIKLARKFDGAAVPLRVANVSVDAVCDDDAKFQQLSRAIPKSSELSMEGMVALLVLPSWVHGKVYLKKFGEMAVDAKMLVICGVPDDLEKVRGLFGEGGTLADIAGNASWQQQVVLVGNNLRVRMPDPYYESADGLYVSAATVLAGQIAKGDETISIAEAQAGDAREILLEGQGIELRWKLTDRRDIVAKVGGRVIPVANKGKKLVFWGVRNLYEVSEDDENYVFGQYPVVRVRDYIAKVLVEFLNSNIFRSNDPNKKTSLKNAINEFLRKNSGDGDETKMLLGGECTDVRDRKVSDTAVDDTKLDIDIVLRFKSSIEEVRLVIRAKKQNDKWEEE